MVAKEKAAKAAKPLKGKALALAIANDVLARLKRKNNIVPIQGAGYVSFSKEAKFEAIYIAEESAQKHLKMLQKGCEVCALGGMFISYIGLKNNVTVQDLELDIGMRESLQEAFSSEQLHLIEGSFEGWCDDNSESVVFYEKFENDKKRLKKIMENIVRNNGKFIPKQDIAEEN